MTIKGIEIDRGDADLSAGVHNGAIEIGIGEGWDHGPDRPQGYLRYMGFRMSYAEAEGLRDWLSAALAEIGITPKKAGEVT